MIHEERKRCRRDLKSLGYEVGTGNLVRLLLPHSNIAATTAMESLNIMIE